MSGVPGSGKSSYATADHNTGAHASRDSLRKLIRIETGSDKYFPVSMKEEWARWVQFFTSCITTNRTRDVWIDQTTIGHGALSKLLKEIAPLMDANDHIVLHVMDTPLATCVTRNAGRSGFERVPQDVLTGMHKRFCMEPLSLENVYIIAEEFGIMPDQITVRTVKP